MAHSLSAKKRARQNVVSRASNRMRKSQVKTAVNSLEDALEAGDVAAAKEQLVATTKKLDQVASTSAMHKRTAARKKSRLAKKVNALEAKQG